MHETIGVDAMPEFAIKIRNEVKGQCVQKLSNLSPASNSKPMMDSVALKFGMLIAKMLFNENSMSPNPALMPVAH